MLEEAHFDAMQSTVLLFDLFWALFHFVSTSTKYCYVIFDIYEFP